MKASGGFTATAIQDYLGRPRQTLPGCNILRFAREGEQFRVRLEFLRNRNK